MPTHNRVTLLIAAAIHALLLAGLIQVTTKPVRVSSAGSPQGGIAAYVVGPIGATQAAPKPPEAKTALKTEVAKNAPKETHSDVDTAAGSAGVVGGGQAGSGPVRLGSGGIALVRKVQPVYPAVMQSARVSGQVQLDAIIHADGTIGDVTVLRSTNGVFAQSAIDAVKQWKYTPIGFEAIVTVTVNFTLT